MKHIIGLLLILMASNAFAGFGGSRGGGSFSAGRSSFSAGRSSFSSSSFGGSRGSMGAPVTISRPAYSAPARSYSAPVNTHTIVHNNSSPGFFSGMMMGSLMNHHPAPIIVAPGVGGVVAQDPVYVESGHSFFYYLFNVTLFVCAIAFIVWLVKRARELA